MFTRKSTTRLVMGVAALTMSSGMLGVPDANAALTTALHSYRNRKCLDADISRGDYNGMKVQLWDCNGRSNQRWIVTGNSWIKSVRNGKCLDADISHGNVNGMKVQLWDCNGRSNQTWFYNGFGMRELITPWNHKCLDADISHGDYNGMKVQLWTCNGWSNQMWTMP